MKKLLVVVDYQNDFVDGALGFEGAEKLEAGIAGRVENTLAQGGYVLFTRDTHGPDYLETREGKYLPVPHCLEGTAAHNLFGRLHKYEEEAAPRTAVINKETFGSPDIVKAAEALCQGAPDEIEMCGVVTDICVVTNTLLLHTGFARADVKVIKELCGTGNKENGERAFALLCGMGVAVC